MLFMDIEYNKGILFVRLDGNLTRKNTYKINNYLAPVVLKHRIKFLVYNLTMVSKVDQDGLDAILRTKYAIRRNEGQVFLCEIPYQFKGILKKLRLKEMNAEHDAFKLLKV